MGRQVSATSRRSVGAAPTTGASSGRPLRVCGILQMFVHPVAGHQSGLNSSRMGRDTVKLLECRQCGREKNVREFGFSAICGERKRMPCFDVSRWFYGKTMESMEGRLLLGVQEVPSSNLSSPTIFINSCERGCFSRRFTLLQRLLPPTNSVPYEPPAQRPVLTSPSVPDSNKHPNRAMHVASGPSQQRWQNARRVPRITIGQRL